MNDDLIKRLRDLGDHASFEPHMHHAAADRIEELSNCVAVLEAKMAKLRAERNHANDVTDAAIEEIERLKAQPVAVTVKPLEWEDVSCTLSKAASFDLKFQVRLGTDGMVRWQSKHMGVWRDAPSFAEAKAAAQADYETRILSAITARSEAEVWNEAIEAAADACDDYPRVAPDENEWPHYDAQIAYSQDCIRTLRRPVKGESHE